MALSKANRLIRILANFPFFLIFIGVYPTLFLLNKNLGQIPVGAAGFSALIAVIFSLVISGFCILFIRPKSRALLAAVVLNLAFFTYGHLFNLIDAKTVNGFLVGRHMLFLPLFILLFGSLLSIILKAPALPKEETVRRYGIVVLGGLCLFQLVGILSFNFLTGASNTSEFSPAPLAAGSTVAQKSGPDIYYIILDGLLREDAINELFPELEYSLPTDLEKRGFYIPQCTYSNYASTAKSLASSLNMNYLNALGVEDAEINTNENEPPELYPLLHGNLVVQKLRQQGYKFIAFRGFFPLNDFQNADYYFSVARSEQGQDTIAERSFREMFFRTTMLRTLTELYEGNPQQFNFIPKFVAELIAPEASPFSSRSFLWYQEHLYTFEQLAKIPEIPEKKFIYAHFYTTHQPYVLKADGSFLWPVNEDNDGYRAGVEYTSKRIIEVVDKILAESKQPPIIIIQADHGIGTGLDKHKILNAYYLPYENNGLYDTITPVNTFRLIMNKHAGESFELLPDILMSSQEGKIDFVPIPALCE